MTTNTKHSTSTARTAMNEFYSRIRMMSENETMDRGEGRHLLRLRAIALALRVLRLRAIALALRVLRLRAIALALRVLRLRAIALALRAWPRHFERMYFFGGASTPALQGGEFARVQFIHTLYERRRCLFI